MLTREADGRAFRLIGVGAHDLIDAAEESLQGDLLGGGPADSPVDRRWTACGRSLAIQSIVKGRGFGVNLKRQGPSKVE